MFSVREIRLHYTLSRQELPLLPSFYTYDIDQLTLLAQDLRYSLTQTCFHRTSVIPSSSVTSHTEGELVRYLSAMNNPDNIYIAMI